MKKRTDQSNLTIPPLNDACRKRLRLLRERLGLSRPKFADMLGIPATTLKFLRAELPGNQRRHPAVDSAAPRALSPLHLVDHRPG